MSILVGEIDKITYLTLCANVGAGSRQITLSPPRSLRSDGKSPHTAYPFALHDTHNLPWDYRVKNNKMFLFARSCDGEAPSKDQPCHRCNRLGRNNISHYGIAGLRELLRLQNRQAEHYRLSALNQARKVARKARALADHKRFLTAVASKRVERVDRIIRLGLRHGRGIRSLLDQCVKAAGGLYKPKDYQEEDGRSGFHPSLPSRTRSAFHLLCFLLVSQPPRKSQRM